MRRKGRGWWNEPRRHALAAKGIKTYRKRTSSYPRYKYLMRTPLKFAKSTEVTQKEIMKRVEQSGAPTDKLPKNPGKYYREKYPNAWWPENVNWDYLIRELEYAEESPEDIMGNVRKEIVIGSVYDATPSGKYYTSWASSNVDEEEALADAWHWAELELAAEKRGVYIDFSEYDPDSIVLGKMMED